MYTNLAKLTRLMDDTNVNSGSPRPKLFYLPVVISKLIKDMFVSLASSTSKLIFNPGISKNSITIIILL